MRMDTQFSVFLVNQPGVLAKVTEAIGRAKINIVALSMMDSSEHGVLRMVVDEPTKAREVLRKHHDNWAESEVIALELPNQPGALASVARRLADEHINISYAYTSGGAPGGRTTCIFKAADPNKALKLLTRMESKQAAGSGTASASRGKTANVRRPPAGRRR